jgi:hypothetical protein
VPTVFALFLLYGQTKPSVEVFSKQKPMAMALLWQHCCRNQRFHSQPLEAPRKFTLADNSEVAL